MADKTITDLLQNTALAGDELIEIAQLSDTVAMTAATISAEAADNSFNDSALGFIAAGFAVNDRVRVKGFTGDTANNLFVGVVTALTTGKMTIGGTDGDVIVDDAAGESVTIAKWVSRRAAFGAPAPSPVVTDASANRDITATGAGSYIRMTKADGAKTVTFRPDATEPLPANAEWHIRCTGSQVTLTPGAGVTLNAPAGGTLVLTAGMVVTAKRVAEDMFDILGQTVPA